MVREPSICFRHPERIARRRCYYCRRWICPRCQYRRSHHIFCRATCYYRWWGIDRFERARRWRRAHAVWLATVGVTVWVGWAILIGLHFWHRALDEMIRTYRTAGLPVPRVSGSRDRTPIPGIRITRPAFGARVPAGVIVIEGRAPAHCDLVLWLNGEPFATSTTDATGWFIFRNVPLLDDDNLFQIQARLPDGNEIYSPAVIVYRIHPRARTRQRYVQRSPDNLIRGNPEIPEIALTFDGHLSDRDVLDLIAWVERARIPVTVFLTGTFIRRFPESTRALAQSPWIEVGNHTLHHRHLTTFDTDHRQVTRTDLDRMSLQHELIETARLFRQVTGVSMAPLWRAPYGEHNTEIRAWAGELGYTHVAWTVTRDWSLDTMDWIDDPSDPRYRPARAILERILRIADTLPRGIAGGIVLMHLGTRRPRGDRMIDVLPDLVAQLQQRGYRFVRVSTLLRHLRGTGLRTVVHTTPRMVKERIAR